MNIVLEILSYMAQQEREKIKSRHAEGVAKAKGKHLGRPKAEYLKEFAKYYDQWKTGNLK